MERAFAGNSSLGMCVDVQHCPVIGSNGSPGHTGFSQWKQTDCCCCHDNRSTHSDKRADHTALRFGYGHLWPSMAQGRALSERAVQQLMK